MIRFGAWSRLGVWEPAKLDVARWDPWPGVMDAVVDGSEIVGSASAYVLSLYFFAARYDRGAMGRGMLCRGTR